MTRTRSRTKPRTLRLEALERRDVPSWNFDPASGRGEDAAGNVYYALVELPTPTKPPEDNLNRPKSPPFDLSETFLLHSHPFAKDVIYLDFDGNTTTGTFWNDANHPTIVTPAFDTDGNASTFSDPELERIQRIWQRVSEDYSPFDVDVTTEFPGIERLRNTGGSDDRWGIRANVGGDGSWFGQVGGVAYIGSFDWDTDIGCFIFADNLGDGDEKYTAEAISHEVGHTLGLSHDGRNSPSEGYYAGHGSGETGWAPIMGVGYYQNLSQWSKGEYLSANQKQDDLNIIATQNGFGYRLDDHGSTAATATAATLNGPTTITGSGVIEKRGDFDYFSFTTGAGPISITVDPFERGPNLDIFVGLYNANGQLIDSSNPADSLAATVTANVPYGTYFLKIDGVGKGNPLGSGYTDYASLGQYSFTGTIKDPPPPAPLRVLSASTIESSRGLVTAMRVTFNVAPQPLAMAPGKFRVTGPAGASVPILGFKPVSADGAIWNLQLTPQKFVGAGGVRLWVSPTVASKAGQLMDQDQDGLPGEAEDYFAAAAFQFNSATAGLITDAGTTDFPIDIGRNLNIRDVNVRVNLTHPYLSDLEVDLISPANKIVKLFDHRGEDGNDLKDTRFDDSAAKGIDTAAAPFAGVFRPDGDALANLIDDDAQGTWLLRIIDSYAGATGQVNSWGLTLTTDSARGGAALISVNPVNETGSAIATRVTAMQLVFLAPMNSATISPADMKVIDPRGLPVRILSVIPVAGTNNTRFQVATASWLRSGNYTVKIGSAVADVFGNGLDGNGNGAFLEASDANVSTKSIANDVYPSKNKPLAIPRGGSVTAAIAVGGSFKIGELAIELNIQHPSVGDLKITLIAPNGSQFVLIDHRGGTGANLVRTVMSDAAINPVSGGAAPFGGDFQPEQSLSGLVGLAVKGTWKLKVEDTGSGTVGRLLSWAIYVKPQ